VVQKGHVVVEQNTQSSKREGKETKQGKLRQPKRLEILGQGSNALKGEGSFSERQGEIRRSVEKTNEKGERRGRNGWGGGGQLAKRKKKVRVPPGTCEKKESQRYGPGEKKKGCCRDKPHKRW